ncbi:hypothetical protein ACLEX4_23070, partial [Pseudescherichia vulneris]
RKPETAAGYRGRIGRAGPGAGAKEAQRAGIFCGRFALGEVESGVASHTEGLYIRLEVRLKAPKSPDENKTVQNSTVPLMEPSSLPLTPYASESCKQSQTNTLRMYIIPGKKSTPGDERTKMSHLADRVRRWSLCSVLRQRQAAVLKGWVKKDNVGAKIAHLNSVNT